MTNIDQSNGKEMSKFSKIINVFLAPRSTFESIDRKPDWIVPLLIVVIIAFVISFLIMPFALDRQFDMQRAKMQERGMSDEEIENALELGRPIAEKVGPISALVVTAIFLVILAALLYFLGNIILGGKTTFKKIFSVVTYTSLIGSLGSLVLLPIMLSKRSVDVHFSLATFMPEK